MTADAGDDRDAAARQGGLSRIGRFLTSPLRRLVSNSTDSETARARAMTDHELADALEREVYAAQNTDDEIWVEGGTLIEEAARRLRSGSAGSV